MTEDTSSWQSAASAAEECQYLNRIYYKEDFKVIFFWLSGVKKWMEICAIEGRGGSNAMANAILKFQFFLEYSLKLPYHRQCSKCLFTWFNFAHNCTKHQLVLRSTSSCFNYLNKIHTLKQARFFDIFSQWLPSKMPTLRLPVSR